MSEIIKFAPLSRRPPFFVQLQRGYGWWNIFRRKGSGYSNVPVACLTSWRFAIAWLEENYPRLVRK